MKGFGGHGRKVEKSFNKVSSKVFVAFKIIVRLKIVVKPFLVLRPYRQFIAEKVCLARRHSQDGQLDILFGKKVAQPIQFTCTPSGFVYKVHT
jgi:hypothetical protein